MSEEKPTRRDILRPLHLLGIALACGVFAMIVTLLMLAMLILAVDPADVTKTVDRPVLYDPESDDGTATGDARTDRTE